MQEQKTKKKSYEQLSQEVRDIVGKTAVVYVPELAYALKNEGYSNQEARDKILEDFGDKHPWADNTIYEVFPIELRDPEDKKHGHRTSVSEVKRQTAIQELKQTFKPIPKPTEPVHERVEETDDDIGLSEELQPIGENGKDTMSTYGEINAAARNLWTALTGKDNFPGFDEDFIVDYIKPTREYRKKFILELKHQKSDMLSLSRLKRNLVLADHVLGDMLELVDE